MFGDEPEHADEETKDEPLKAAQATMTSTMKSGTAKKKKMVEIDPEEEERRKKEEEAKKQELEDIKKKA